MKPYPAEVEAEMKKFYETLSGKDKRRYAAIEALKLGHGGIGYVAQVWGCDRDTVSKGLDELQHLPEGSGYDPRIRQPGGGRKSYEASHPGIDERFLEVMAEHTAGDPMHDDVRWTNLSMRQIIERLAERHGLRVSKRVIRQWMDKHHYRRRKAQKNDDEGYETSA
jgi:hypothetical protein